MSSSLQIKAVQACMLSLVLGSTAMAGDRLLFKNATVDTNSPANMSALMSLDGGQIETQHYVIQYVNKITQSDQQKLKDLGVKALRYVPEDAYIIQVESPTALRVLNSDANVKALVPYLAEFKVNYKDLANSVFNRNALQKLHVRAFENLDYDLIEDQLRNVSGLKVLERDGGAFIVEAPVSSLDQVAQIDGLEWVDEYLEFKMQIMEVNPLNETAPADKLMSIEELTGLESGTEVSQFKAAWERGYTGQGQVVAVADTGLDTGDASSLNPEFHGFKRGIIGGLFSSHWGDPNGHGTHVAGSIVSSGVHSQNKVRGGAYNAQLVAESMWSEVYNNLTIGPDPSNIFEQAYAEGARVHSNSWGSVKGLGRYDDTARATDEFMWKNPDMLIVFAAGNSGVDMNQDGRVDMGSVSSPGTAKNVLTVGASENKVDKGGMQKLVGELGSPQSGYRWPAAPLSTDKLSDNINGIAAFSSRGPTLDQRLKPEIVAPGTNILSQCSQYSGAGDLWGRMSDGLCFCGGTSMSTPLVSAGAVVVREYLIKEQGREKPSSALVKAVLLHNTDDLYPGQFGEVGEAAGQELLKPGPNNNQGYGRMNMKKATAAKSAMRVIDSYKGLKQGEAHTYYIAKGTRKITLAYTDAPGSTAAEKALVNDIDIRVTLADGTVLRSSSKLNNIEQIELPANSEGIKLEILGVNIPMVNEDLGGQSYAVVATLN